MKQFTEFFAKLFDSSNWPPRWHCGQWTAFHGWLFIISDLLIWSAYFTIPVVILRYISKKQSVNFIRLYFLFAAFILACGATHLLDAFAFWIPVYRLSALVRFITGVISWVTVFYLIKYLPVIFSLKSHTVLEAEIKQRIKAEEALSKLNAELEQRVEERTEEIRKSEMRFRALIENSAEGISLLDANSNVLYRSPSAYKILGNNPKEDVISLAHPDSVENFKRKFAEALSKPGIPVPYQVKYLHHDGHHFWSEGTFTNLLHLDAVHSVVANFRDVTSRKIAEEELKESERRYRYLFENNPMPMFVMDLKTFKFLAVNEIAIENYGYKREEILSMTALDIRPQEDRELFKKLDFSFNNYATNYNKGIWRHQKKDGTIIKVEVIGHEILYEGISCRLLLANDVTNQKKAEKELAASEKRFRALVENNYDITTLVDASFKIIYRSPSASRVMGFDDVDMPVMEGIENIHPDDRNYVEQVVKEAITNPGKPIHAICRRQHKDGHYVWLEGVITNMLQDEEIKAFVTNFRDVTERIEADQKIQKLNAELEEKVTTRTEKLRKTNEELEAFSYSVSHDLRAPLRSIIGFANILEEDYGEKLDMEAKRITGIIKNNTAKMGRLIDDLLSFSRLGKQELLKAWINMNKLVEEVIHETGVEDTIRPIVKWHLHELPVSYADKSSMRQVWVNLISNAVKYSGKTANPEIEIGCLPAKDKNTFYIKDNGIGFNEKYKDKLFKVFQRLSSSKDFEGTGIGLAIIHKIITRHGGEVWADAKLGEGATFYFSLPLNG